MITEDIDLEEMFEKETGKEWAFTRPDIYTDWLEEKLKEQIVKNSSIPLVSESFMSKLSDKKDMMYKELKQTVDVEYFSFIGGWTTAIGAMKALGEKIYSR